MGWKLDTKLHPGGMIIRNSGRKFATEEFLGISSFGLFFSRHICNGAGIFIPKVLGVLNSFPTVWSLKSAVGAVRGQRGDRPGRGRWGGCAVLLRIVCGKS